MKNTMKQIIATLAFISLLRTGYSQGQLSLDNLHNDSQSPSATSNGLFWISTGGAPALLNQDINAVFYIGTNANNLPVFATFLLSNGTANGDNVFGPGTFTDPTLKNYTLPSSTSVFIQIQAWTGNFDSYAAAINAGAPAAQSPIFINPVDVPPGPVSELISMPAMVLAVPEPSILALLSVAGLAWLLFVRYE